MPRTRLPTVCTTPGCPNLQPCIDHARKAWATSTRAGRLPRNWQAIRAAVLKRDGHTCQACSGNRCGNIDLEVDHIAPNDDHSFTNLQTLGHACHQAKTQAEAAAARATRTPR